MEKVRRKLGVRMFFVAKLDRVSQIQKPPVGQLGQERDKGLHRKRERISGS